MSLSSRQLIKSITIVILVILLSVSGSIYFSLENSAYRAYMNMRDTGNMEYQIIDRFIRNTETSGPEYYEALNLAAALDDDYLDHVITLYAEAAIILRRKAAMRILALLPSDSLKVNTAAGRILSSNDFVPEEPHRARQLLEYSALRGDRHAAVFLTKLYARFNCPVAEATWARIANQREQIAVCDQIQVDVQQFTDDEWGLVADNELSLKKAWSQGEVPEMSYPASCVLLRYE